MFSLKLVKGAELADGVVAELRLPELFSRFSIGRDPSNQWPIPDRTLAISARHCEIVATANGAALRDLSTNGTFVNGGPGRLMAEHLLRDGDRIEMGPYTILVQAARPRVAAQPDRHADVSLPMPGRAAAGGTPAAMPKFSTAAIRGGDPAAMLSGGGPERVGLTEMLRHAAPAEDSELALTKIRPAPRGAAAGSPAAPRVAVPAASAAPSAISAPSAPSLSSSPFSPSSLSSSPAPAWAAESAAAAAPKPAPARAAAEVGAPDARAPGAGGSDALLAALAAGLGLPPGSLAGRDPAQAVAQVGSLARAAVLAMRTLLEQQARMRRQIGSRSPALQSMREVNPLRLAATPEAVLLALLAPGADAVSPLQRAATDLAVHQDRLMAAFGEAASRLGQEMAPEALVDALAAADPRGGREARLWELYTGLWQGIGLTPGQPWSKGFLEAALLHLAAAYDEPGKP